MSDSKTNLPRDSTVVGVTVESSESAPLTGFITTDSGRIFYKKFPGGNSGNTPVLVVAGGPGFPHDYLEPLSELSSHGHDVFFFDYLGCGASDAQRDAPLINMPSFVAELVAVRSQLALTRPIVVAHSFGTATTLEYLSSNSESNDVEALVLISPFPSAPEFVEAKRSIVANYDAAQSQAALNFTGETKSDIDYQLALARFNAEAVMRRPMPDCLRRSRKGFNEHLHTTMWGRAPFQSGGLLKDWSIVDRLDKVRLPTLIISGRHDECVPDIVATVHRGIESSRWIILENSSHMAHLEETEEFLRHLLEFIGSGGHQLPAPSTEENRDGL